VLNSSKEEIDLLFANARKYDLTKGNERKVGEQVDRSNFVLVSYTEPKQISRIPALILCQEKGLLKPGQLFIDMSTQIGFLHVTITPSHIPDFIVICVNKRGTESKEQDQAWEKGQKSKSVCFELSTGMVENFDLFVQFKEKHWLHQKSFGEVTEPLSSLIALKKVVSMKKEHSDKEIAEIEVKVGLF